MPYRSRRVSYGDLMTRKDFQAVADTLGAIPGKAAREREIDRWCKLFEKENPRFDARRFRAAVEKAAGRGNRRRGILTRCGDFFGNLLGPQPRYRMESGYAYKRVRGRWDTVVVSAPVINRAKFVGFHNVDGQRMALFKLGKAHYAQLPQNIRADMKLGIAGRRRRRRRYGNSAPLSERQARAIERAYEQHERAREKWDPKRYKRGGGYSPEEMRAINHMAKTRSPSNRALNALELRRFMTERPDRVFAYYDKDMRTVTTFMGSKLGDIVWKGAVQRRFGGTRMRAIQVRGVNGVAYHGLANLDTGTYVRLRAMKTR